MDYIPSRIMVPLQPTVSRALGQLAEWREEHPRETAQALIREGLEYAGMILPSCPQCDRPTIADPRRPGVRFCEYCQEPVLYIQDSTKCL